MAAVGTPLTSWPKLPPALVEGAGPLTLFGEEASGVVTLGLLRLPGLPLPWEINGGIALLPTPGPLSDSKGSSGSSFSAASSVGLGRPPGFPVISSLS